jgi:hypothetical protein
VQENHAQGGFALRGESNLLMHSDQPRCDRAWTCGFPGTQPNFKTLSTAARARALGETLQKI